MCVCSAFMFDEQHRNIKLEFRHDELLIAYKCFQNGQNNANHAHVADKLGADHTE
jgi:hypothetical protein